MSWPDHLCGPEVRAAKRMWQNEPAGERLRLRWCLLLIPGLVAGGGLAILA